MNSRWGSSTQLNDPLHGIIKISSYEKVIIDHPLFQRLRHVIQNDVLQMVFPGATHNRFIHCIGAMHVSGRMFDSIVENSVSVEKDSSNVIQSLDYIKKCLRAAVLLHDSHLPFSHQAERSVGVNKVLQSSGFFESLWADVDESIVAQIYPVKPSIIEHEHFSVRVAFEIMRDEGFEECFVRDVLSIMDTTNIVPSSAFTEAASASWAVFAGQCKTQELVSVSEKAKLVCGVMRKLLSSEFDADRADYLLRDSHACGTSLGLFDLDILIKNLCVSWSPDYKTLCLCLKDKGLSCFEHFLSSRYRMYQSIYGHSCSRGFELMVQFAITEVLEEPSFFAQFVDCITDIKKFKYLTDSFFWEGFRAVARKSEDSFCGRILNRRKLDFIVSVTEPDINQSPDLKRCLAKEIGVEPDQIIEYKNKLKLTKLTDNGCESNLMILVNNYHGSGYSLTPICQVSDMLLQSETQMVYSYFMA